MRTYDHSLFFRNGHNYHFYKHGGGLVSVVHSPHDRPSIREGQSHVATAYDPNDLGRAVIAHAKKNGIKMPVGTGLAKAKQGAHPMRKSGTKSLVVCKGRPLKKSSEFLPKGVKAAVVNHPADPGQWHAAARTHVFMNHGPTSPTEHKRMAATHTKWAEQAHAGKDPATAQGHLAMARAHRSMGHEKQVGEQLSSQLKGKKKPPPTPLPTFEEHAKEVGSRFGGFPDGKSMTVNRYFVDEEARVMKAFHSVDGGRLVKGIAIPDSVHAKLGRNQDDRAQTHAYHAAYKHIAKTYAKDSPKQHYERAKEHALAKVQFGRAEPRLGLAHGAMVQAHMEHFHQKSAAVATGATNKSMSEENQTMSGYEDLFKSELGIFEDKYLIDCPHCDHPITKSEVLAKAAKGSDVHANTQPTVGGSPGSKTVQKIRPGKGGKMIGVANPGSHGVNKSDTESDDDDEDKKKKDKYEDVASKAFTGPRFIGGSRYVQYVDTGEDAAIAEMISKGMLGDGAMPNIPLDRNQSPSRNVGG